MAAAAAATAPSSYRNYGKVPKYIEKYKEEAKDVERKRAELRAKKLLPPGMIQMPEAERV